MTPTQADVDRWAATVAESYAAMCNPPLTPIDARDLVLMLDEPLAHCIMLALPLAEWGTEGVNPALDRWEQKVRRPRGPRLRVVDYGAGRVTMG